MKMNSNSMLCGSASNGIVVTDLSVNVLVAMRDSINEAIKGRMTGNEQTPKAYHEKLTMSDYLCKIREAIHNAEDAGYELWIDDDPVDAADLYLELADDDDWDEDEDDDWDDDDPYDDTDDESYEYDPCQVCHRKYCEGCRLHEM